jgi:hypothetical protein
MDAIALLFILFLFLVVVVMAKKDARVKPNGVE